MADGTINIDVLLHKEKFLPDYDIVKKLLTELGIGTGDKMEQEFSSNADKMSNKAQSVHNKIKDEMGKAIKPVLKADTSEFDEKMSRANRSRQKFENPVKQKFQADFSGFNHGVRKAINEIELLREKSKNFRSILAGTTIGNIIGNATMTGLSTLKNGILGAANAGIQFDKQMQTMLATWTTLTGSAKEGQKMVDMTTDMAAAAANSVDMVQDLNQKLYAVTNSADQTKVLTKSILTLQDAFGQTDDAVRGFTTQFSQMQANGKVSAQDMMSFVNVFPKIRTELLETMRQQTKNHNLTMQQMNDMMSAGKISAKTMDEVITGMGRKYQSATENFGATLDGMSRTIKGRLPSLLGSFVQPFVKVSNPIFGSVSKWVSDPKTNQVFEKAGNIVSRGMNRVVSAFNPKEKGDFSKTANNLVTKFAENLSHSLEWISKHAGDLKTIAKSIGEITSDLTTGYISVLGDIFKIFTGAKGDGVKAIADGLSRMAKHKDAIKTIGSVMATYFVASKLIGGAETIGRMAIGLRDIASVPVDKIRKVMDALSTTPSAGSSVVDAAAMTRGERFGTAKASKGLLGGIASKLMPKGLASKMLSFGKGLGGKLVAGLGLALSAFDLVKAFTTKDQNKKAENAGKGIGGLLGAGIGFALGGPAGAAIGNIIGDLAGGWVVKATKKFGNGWNDWAKGFKPHGIMAKVGFDTHEALFKLNNFTAKVEKKHPVIAPMIRVSEGSIKSMWKAIQLPEKSFAVGFGLSGKEAGDLFSGHFNKMWPDLVKTSKGFLGSIIDDAKSVWDTITGNRHVDKKTKPKKSKKSKHKTSTEEAIEDVATVKVTKKDIDNVKAIIPLIQDYEDALKSISKSMKSDPFKKLSKSLPKLKKALKNNDISKEAKSQQKAVKSFSKAINSTNKAVNKLGKSNKNLVSFKKNISSLYKTLKSDKIGDSLKKLKKDLKNNNPSKELKAVSKEIKSDSKSWSKLAKPISTLAKSFKTLSKSMKSIEKDKGLSKLNKDLSKLDRTAAKSKFGSELKKQFQIANKAVGNTGFIKVFHNMTNSIVRDLNRFKSNFKRDWERLWKDAANDEKKDVNKIESDLSSSTNKMLKTENSFSNSFEKTWKSLGNSLRSSWKSVWKDIADLSNSGMHKTAGYINSGIQGIDYVLGKFGGSPKTISPIKFASGTGLVENGRLTRGTLAMLNDGNDSPETNNVERVVKADGRSYEPAGNNVLHYLEPGDAVLNATENKMFKMSGLTHFADGTGIFSSSLFKGVNGGYQQLIELAERLSSSVNKSFAALFSKKPKIKGDVPKAFESIFKKQADKQGQKWWATVWDVINEAIGGASGDATGLLKAVEKYGTGKPYVWGATGPDSFDCSGLVMYALKQAFGISYPHFSGDQIARTQHISKDQLRPGDLIGNDEHIGVYAGNGKYWSAMSPSSHPNIGMSPVSTFPGTPIYGRVRGLKSEDDKKKDTKADKGLVGLVKKELGPGVFSFIKKHLAPLVMDSDGVGTASGGKVSGDLIREAAKIAGVSISASDIRHIESVIQHESGGNPTIVNHWDKNAKLGHPSKGILQFIDSTFMHYAMPGHKNILSALDQLVAMFNDTTWRSDLTLGGWGPTGAVRHANGGWGQWGKLNIFNEVPGEPEVAINPSRATADDLIMETIAERLKKAPNGKLAHALNAISHVPEQAHQFAGKAIANVSNPTNTGANVATAGEGGNINTVINLDGKVIADATYPINQARQSKQITIETKKRGGFH